MSSRCPRASALPFLEAETIYILEVGDPSASSRRLSKMASSPLGCFIVSWSENVTEKWGERGRNDTFRNSNSRLETTFVIRLVISGSHSGCVEMNRDATGCVGQSAAFRVHLRVSPVQRVRPISTFLCGGDVRFASKVKVSWRRRQRHTAHLTGISRGANLASSEGCRKAHPESLNRARK